MVCVVFLWCGYNTIIEWYFYTHYYTVIFSIIDIDECALSMSDCDSIKGEVCSNTDGSFQCLCDEARDYVKRDDLCIRSKLWWIIIMVNTFSK